MRITKQLLVVAIAAMFVACGNKGNTESDTTTATEQEQVAVKVVSKVTLTTFKADKDFVKSGKEINSTVIEYDREGNISKITKPNGLDIECNVENNQITSVVGLGEWKQYKFSVKGNTAKYDNNSTETHITIKFDENLNVVSSEAGENGTSDMFKQTNRTYKYDNSLIKSESMVESRMGECRSETNITYEYEANGENIQDWTICKAKVNWANICVNLEEGGKDEIQEKKTSYQVIEKIVEFYE